MQQIFFSFWVSQKEEADYETILQKSEEYFVPSENVWIYTEKDVFWWRLCEWEKKHRGASDWYKTVELGLQFSVPVSWRREQILKRGDTQLSYD